MALTAGFNPAGAVSGNSILATDAGDATAWNSVSTVSGWPKYSNSIALFGKTLSARVATAGTAPSLSWSTSYASPAEDYGRLYLYINTLPSAAGAPLVFGNVINGFSIVLTSAGKITINKSTGAAQATSATTLSALQWYRIEYHYATGASTPSVSIYTSPDSASAAETLTASSWTVVAAPSILFGGDGNTKTFDLNVAQIAVLGTAAIGPYPVNSIAPAVSGSAPAGSTLTAANGTWNGTFNYTYQWTSNGSNIAAATSSTY
ncbi:MAG TPA: hypothetical protein VN039_07685, partial [Nitrospira sp.]|nr:hypothetical protein [Nitrospira sp.]